MSTDIRKCTVFLLGFGGVGRSLARQIVATRTLHAERNHIVLTIIGIADSNGIYCSPEGITDSTLSQIIHFKTTSGRLGVEQNPMSDLNLETQLPAGTIVVDTTAAVSTAPLLISASESGYGVVLANKLPIAGELSWYDAISGGLSRWETTVGAALPVISTVRTLLDSGDAIRRIEGSLSGTLGYIASQLEAGIAFGDAVRDARERGYTEPDPRQDLGGLDAARKALILARMMGYRLTMSDVQVESLYPSAMDHLSVTDFMREVDSLNTEMARRAKELTAGGKKLRYAATVENGECRVGLAGADPTSKLGGIHTSDSIVVFYTRFYNDNPLAISGRGAGQEVTASGVLGDIMSLAREMA